MGDKDNENLREHSGAGTGAPKGIKGEGFGDDQACLSIHTEHAKN